MLEFTPTNLRTYMTTLCLTTFALGYLLVDLIAFYLRDWRFIFYIVSAIGFLGIIPMFFLPESPRYLLTQNKPAQAKTNLEEFSRSIRNPISMAEVDLVFTPHKQNWLKQIKDFYVYPKLGQQTTIFALCWLIVCSLCNTFNFGWSKISKDFYIGYIYAGLGSMLSYYLVIPVTKFFGKKNGIIGLLMSSCFFYCVAMANYDIYATFTVEHMASLLGFMSIVSSFTMIYLHTGELTPTSHRGMVFCICGSFGRVGSFLGPYIQLLFTLLDKRITFGIFAGVSMICAIIISFTRDPTGRAMPETPKELDKVN